MKEERKNQFHMNGQNDENYFQTDVKSVETQFKIALVTDQICYISSF